jgi:hypothetical protein
MRNEKAKAKEVAEIIFTTGETQAYRYQGYRVMIKMNLQRGSRDSIDFLSDLYGLGYDCDIFKSETIQKLLDYKFWETENLFISCLYHS